MFKRTIALGALVGVACLGQDHRIAAGFNAIELSAARASVWEYTARSHVRAYTNVTLDGKLTLSGFNDLDIAHPETYLGRNLLIAGSPAGHQAIAEFSSTAKHTSVRGGYRDMALNRLLHAHGYTDATFGKDDASITSFKGWQLKKGFSVDTYGTAMMSYRHARAIAYGEAQLNKSLGTNHCGAPQAYIQAQRGRGWNAYVAGVRIDPLKAFR